MDDLVERLHTYRPPNEWGDGVHHVICDEAASRIQALETSLAEAEGQLAALKDPQAVHVALLRGSIAKPGPECAWHLYQRDLLDAMPADYRGEVQAYIWTDPTHQRPPELHWHYDTGPAYEGWIITPLYAEQQL